MVSYTSPQSETCNKKYPDPRRPLRGFGPKLRSLRSFGPKIGSRGRFATPGLGELLQVFSLRHQGRRVQLVGCRPWIRQNLRLLELPLWDLPETGTDGGEVVRS